MEGKSAVILGVVIACFILTYVSVSLRVFTRLRVNKSFGPDDAIVIVLLIIFTGYLSAQIQGYRHGVGQHEDTLTPENRSAALMWWWICFLMYIVCVCLFKVAVVLFLSRVAVEKLHVWLLNTIMLGVAVCGSAYFFTVAFQCWPVSAWWTDSPRSPKCWNGKIVFGLDLAASIVNCGVDWVLGILPIFMVKGLQMRLRTKILVGGLLSLAAFGSTATFIRMFFLPNMLNGGDFLYAASEVAYLSTVESAVGITCVSLGTLKPLVEQWRNRRGTNVGSGASNRSPWSSRHRASPNNHNNNKNNNNNRYIRARGDDRSPTPRSMFGSMFDTIKSAGSSVAGTQTSVSHVEQQDRVAGAGAEDINTATNWSEDIELADPKSEEHGRPENRVGVAISSPSPAALSSPTFIDDDNSSIENGRGSPRIPRFTPLPSLRNLIKSYRRKSMGTRIMVTTIGSDSSLTNLDSSSHNQTISARQR